MCQHEASWLRSALISGFILVGMLCFLTGIDFISYREAFPVWFTPVFLVGIIALVAMISLYVKWLLRGSQLQTPEPSRVGFLWVLLPISFLCTSSVHRFYPFRLDVAECWMTGNEGIPLSIVVKFNFVLTAIGLGLTVVLAAVYVFGRQRIAILGVLVLAAVLLVPNDDCGNAFNARWIRYVGASPLMFIPNVLVILLTVSACLGIRPKFASFATVSICLSTLVLGIGHMSGIIW